MSRKALLVGINDYPGTQNDLQGCVNDITNIFDVLVKYYSFLPADVAMLSNSRARKSAIIDRLKSMLGRGEQGDTLVFHYSGHGSQVPDMEGDEPDGKDEIICPFDFDWTGGFIKDDDLASLIDGMRKGVQLESSSTPATPAPAPGRSSWTGARWVSKMLRSRMPRLSGAAGIASGPGSSRPRPIFRCAPTRFSAARWISGLSPAPTR